MFVWPFVFRNKEFKENFMKTNNEIEKILLNDSEYDKFVSSKIEKDLTLY